MKALFRKSLLIFPIVLCAACASRPYAHVDKPVHAGDFKGSIGVLERNKSSLYQSQDSVLYYLDKGMLSHYAGEYDESITLLRSAEQDIQAAFTKSVTMEIGSYIVNDAVQEYPGEDYEDIYIKAFNALNYYHKGDLESALVEIRGMSLKLDGLAAKYAGLIANMREEARKKGASVADSKAATTFSNSALGCYLSMLFYRGTGDPNAEVDWRNLRRAFADAPALYNFPVPSTIENELETPKGKARLNIVGFSGLSPVKEERVLRIPLPSGWIKIATPVLVSRPSAVHRIEVVFENGDRHPLELLENIDAVASETFKAKEALIYTKSVIRATIKGVTASAMSEAAREVDDAAASIVLGLFGLGAQIFAEASEQADLRISRYFPAKAYVTGITLDPGIYSFSVNYYDGRGRLIESFPFENVSVNENTLNLKEAVCVQ
ncbi:MAG: hypothetical protein LBF60_03470 [Treponema sp.]|jgi:hypothetical protein|nr:hypothetical protein [Treponema sp.]